MTIYTKLQNMLDTGHSRSKPTPSHLQGLMPVSLPPNHLYHQLIDDNNLEQAFQRLCAQTNESHRNDDVWDYRRHWSTRQSQLHLRLKKGDFQFQTVRLVEINNDQNQCQRREVRCAEDRLMIRALYQVLEPVLHPLLSRQCTHLKGNGGIHQTVRETQAYIQAHPSRRVIKSDIKGYYANINHGILAEQLRHLLPNETRLHALLSRFMRRSCAFGGNYVDIEQGLPLGTSLSPLLGAVYLSPLDALAKTQGGFYRRYMDDWVWILPKRHHLRKAIKAQYNVLHALKVKMHPEKTFIGKVAKGFDFLGFQCCPTGLKISDSALSRRHKKIARLYERGASKQRVGRYLLRWLGWVMIAVPICVHGGNGPCDLRTYNTNIGILAFAKAPTAFWHGSSCVTVVTGTMVLRCVVDPFLLGVQFTVNASAAGSKSGCDFACPLTTCSVYGGASKGLPVELIKFRVE